MGETLTPMTWGARGAWLIATCAVAIVVAFGLPALSAGRSAHVQSVGGCADPDVPTPTDTANPLALPVAPSTGDPLQGAHFFVDGPRHGQAAGAIAHLLGLDPASFADSDSWAAFKANHSA